MGNVMRVGEDVLVRKHRVTKITHAHGTQTIVRSLPNELLRKDGTSSMDPKDTYDQGGGAQLNLCKRIHLQNLPFCDLWSTTGNMYMSLSNEKVKSAGEVVSGWIPRVPNSGLV